MRRKVLSAACFFKRKQPMYGWEALFITLTYALVDGWRGRHISDYLRELGRSVPFKLRYVWVMELQKRGAPHYHVVLWVPTGEKIPMPDRSGQWQHGWSQVERARSPVSYVMKYASKGGDMELPRGARICGAGGLEIEGRVQVRWWLLPRYQRVRCTIGDNVHRCKGGGWVSHTTGEWWPPPDYEDTA